MRSSSTCFAVLIICLVPLCAIAEESGDDGFWGGFDLGVAKLNIARSISGSYSSDSASINLRGGYHWRNKYFAALETGGFGLESSNLNNPSNGFGISQFMLAMRYYANPDRPWFLQGGIGKSHYWTNRPDEIGGWGKAFELGFGWDIPLHDFSKHYYITPILLFSAGDEIGTKLLPGFTQQNTKYHAVSLSIGMTFR